jgi:hypothetical protein
MKFYLELALVSALTIAGLVGIVYLFWSMQPPKVLNTVIHVKAMDGKPNPCPAGYVLARAMFLERDGTTQDAWVLSDNPHPGEFSIDYLTPGESVSLNFQLFPVPSDVLDPRKLL